MKNFKSYVQTHHKIVRNFALGYIVFAGCFMFPLQNERIPFHFMDAYSLLVAYGAVGLFLGEVYGQKQEKKIAILTFLFTALGMVCRYLLEFGEVSNRINFTWLNIISYLIIIPILTVILYLLSIKFLIK